MKTAILITTVLFSTLAMAEGPIFDRTISQPTTDLSTGFVENCRIYSDRVEVSKTASLLESTVSKTQKNTLANSAKVDDLILDIKNAGQVTLDIKGILVAKSYKAQYKEDNELTVILDMDTKSGTALKSDSELAGSLIQQVDLLCDF